MTPILIALLLGTAPVEKSSAAAAEETQPKVLLSGDLLNLWVGYLDVNAEVPLGKIFSVHGTGHLLIPPLMSLAGSTGLFWALLGQGALFMPYPLAVDLGMRAYLSGDAPWGAFIDVRGLAFFPYGGPSVSQPPTPYPTFGVGASLGYQGSVSRLVWRVAAGVQASPGPSLSDPSRINFMPVVRLGLGSWL